MGYASLRSIDYTETAAYSTRAIKAARAEEFYTSKSLHPDLDPSKFQLRESRDSEQNPRSTPIMIFSDVTGSMGSTAHYIAKKGFTTLVEGILERLPVTDPHILLGAVGDIVYRDRGSLQVSQFETSTVLLQQLDKLWVEGAGGPNNFESYNLPWHFAAYHTSCDSFEKRGEKGFLFTVGDEECPPDLKPEDLTRLYGHRQEPCKTNAQILADLADKFHVFHICLTKVGAFLGNGKRIRLTWDTTLGDHVLYLDNSELTAELMISAMQITQGVSKQAVVASWPEAARASLNAALEGYNPSVYSKPGKTPEKDPVPAGDEQGILRF